MALKDSTASSSLEQINAEFNNFLTELSIEIPNLKPGKVLNDKKLEKERLEQEVKNREIIANKILHKIIIWVNEKSKTGIEKARISKAINFTLHPDKLNHTSKNAEYLKESLLSHENKGFYFDKVRTHFQENKQINSPSFRSSSEQPQADPFAGNYEDQRREHEEKMRKQQAEEKQRSKQRAEQEQAEEERAEAEWAKWRENARQQQAYWQKQAQKNNQAQSKEKNDVPLDNIDKFIFSLMALVFLITAVLNSLSLIEIFFLGIIAITEPLVMLIIFIIYKVLRITICLIVNTTIYLGECINSFCAKENSQDPENQQKKQSKKAPRPSPYSEDSSSGWWEDLVSDSEDSPSEPEDAPSYPKASPLSESEESSSESEEEPEAPRSPRSSFRAGFGSVDDFD